LQTALRAGDQSARGRHPRRDHHVDGNDHWRRAEPARADAQVGAAYQTQVAHSPERRTGQAPPARWHLAAGWCPAVNAWTVLIDYGAGAVNPYLAFETLDDMVRQGQLSSADSEKAVKNYVKAVGKGVMKVMSKMGISTAQSYCGVQIFEAVGLNQEFIDNYFT